MKRRRDYRLFKQLLDKYNIRRFYHFTDRANIPSIVNNGGLFSWAECEVKGIEVKHPGGDDLSRSIDCKYNLQDYVRISLCRAHPMMFSAIADRRIIDPVVIEIDTDVLFIEGNIFSDKNAARADSNRGTAFEDFNSIHFVTTQCRSQFDVSESEQPYFQAEILVKKFIPLHYLHNIGDVEVWRKVNQKIYEGVTQLDISSNKPALLIFLINQTLQNSNDKMSEIILESVFSVLKELYSKYKDSRYEIALVGYGDYGYKMFKEDAIVPLNSLFAESTDMVEFKNSIIFKSNKNAFLHKGLVFVDDLLNRWIPEHMDSYPPTVIHITQHGYNGAQHSHLIELAQNIKTFSTYVGNTVLFNLIPSDEANNSVIFPSSISEIGEYNFGEMYFIMSSFLPLYAQKKCFNVQHLSNVGLAFKIEPSALSNIIRYSIPEL